MSQRVYCDQDYHPPADADAERWCQDYHRPQLPRIPTPTTTPKETP